MTTLDDFNQLDQAEALALLHPCVALPEWTHALVQGRPWRDRRALLQAASETADRWLPADLEQALSAHPRIGEKPVAASAESALSRQEQAAVNDRDAELAQALRDGNARYEARFGRVFLIRARGRSGEEILLALQRRLGNSDQQEIQEALAQLREITLLRLQGVICE